MAEHKDPSRVAAGLKASLHNPHVSDEAKRHAQERLESMGSVQHGKAQHETLGTHHVGASHHQVEDNRVLGGYKATLHNESTSPAAKAHAREILEAAGYHVDKPKGTSEEEHTTRVLAGYRAALHNDRVSAEAKAHAREYLREHGGL